MKKEEQLKLLNKALELYTTQDISLEKLKNLLGISKSTLTKFFKENGIKIKDVKSEKTNLLYALDLLKLQSIEEVTKITGICEETLLIASSGLKPSVFKRKIIDLAVLEYINTPRLDKSVEKTSKKYGINKKTLKKYLTEKGIDTPNTRASVDFNYNIFNTIDTEEKAYWLGFMYADGYIEAKGKGVGLAVAIKDIKHLEKFNSFLNYPKGMSVTKSHQFGSKSIINTKGEEMFMVSTQITNEVLWNDLNSKGCVPNKSLILTFPSEEIVPKDLVRHFIRGYFDGDGNLGIYKHSRSNPTLEESLIFVGTKPFLEKVQEYLGTGYLMHKSNCNDLTYRLSYSTNKANQAARIMYDNSTIYLDRKYDIYTLFLCRRKIEQKR